MGYTYVTLCTWVKEGLKKKGDSGILHKTEHFIVASKKSRRKIFTNGFFSPPTKIWVTTNKAIVNSTQKPKSLLIPLIKIFSDEGDHVLDLCSGVGSVAISAMITCRDSTSIDDDKFQVLFIIFFSSIFIIN